MRKQFAINSLAPETGRNPSDSFSALNDNYSSQDRRTEPKLVWLELSGHEDSESVRNIFLVCLLIKWEALHGRIRN
jgi:hypothetical protein